jgi:hypothetical protein
MQFRLVVEQRRVLELAWPARREEALDAVVGCLELAAPVRLSLLDGRPRSPGPWPR